MGEHKIVGIPFFQRLEIIIHYSLINAAVEIIHEFFSAGAGLRKTDAGKNSNARRAIFEFILLCFGANM